MKKPILFYLLILVCLSGCLSDPYDEVVTVMGYTPIYINLESGELVSEAPREYDNLINFVFSNDLILMVERGKGVHVVDNSNPESPIDLNFLNVPGTIGLIVKDNFAIVATTYRLVSVDISDFSNATVSSVTFSDSGNGIGLLPPDQFSDFECLDPSKGILAGWEEKLLTDPKCWK